MKAPRTWKGSFLMVTETAVHEAAELMDLGATACKVGYPSSGTKASLVWIRKWNGV